MLLAANIARYRRLIELETDAALRASLKEALDRDIRTLHGLNGRGCSPRHSKPSWQTKGHSWFKGQSFAPAPSLLHFEPGLSLAFAVVAASPTPLLLLDGDLTVLAASTSFCRVFHLEPATVQGRRFIELGAGEWDVPQLKSLLNAAIAGAPEIAKYEMDLKSEGIEWRRLVLNAHKVEYDDARQPRLLLTVSDITDARAAEKHADDLLREKVVLLQELQHRVANFLQIIAGILMQNARKVQSEETRSYLQEARQRVMSVAQLQRQLATSPPDGVKLRTYFNDLCQSIGASMILDHQLSLEVEADESQASAEVSVSLGLLVTELVINSVKHAFPNFASGKIVVSYSSNGEDWTLSVSDDGIGMAKVAEDSKARLGTSIVTALASQLQARVEVSDLNPGTKISIFRASADLPQQPSAV